MITPPTPANLRPTRTRRARPRADRTGPHPGTCPRGVLGGDGVEDRPVRPDTGAPAEGRYEIGGTLGERAERDRPVVDGCAVDDEHGPVAGVRLQSAERQANDAVLIGRRLGSGHLAAPVGIGDDEADRLVTVDPRDDGGLAGGDTARPHAATESQLHGDSTRAVAKTIRPAAVNR